MAAPSWIPCSGKKLSPGSSPLPVNSPERGYFVESSLPFSIHAVQFEPEQISGDGEVLLGCCCTDPAATSRTGDRLETWNARAAFRPSTAFPTGYSPLVKSLNRNGTVAAGIFAPYPIVKINDYGLFRWPLAGQPELLSPHLNPAGLQGPVEISSDGNKIWFFCNSTYGTGYCPVTVPKPKPWVAEIWSQNRGFTLANADLSGRFNYVTPLGNGDTSIAGVIGTSDFGLVGPNGQFTPLSGFPSDLDPKNYVL